MCAQFNEITTSRLIEITFKPIKYDKTMQEYAAGDLLPST